eukprot:403338225
MASINGGNGKYLYQQTGGQILQDGERYNRNFFESNLNRSSSVQTLQKFNHQHSYAPEQNYMTNINEMRGTQGNSNYMMFGRQVSSVRNDSSSNQGNNQSLQKQNTISNSVTNLLQRKNTMNMEKYSSSQNKQHFYLLSPIDQKVVPVENIFKKQKTYLREQQNIYSSHRNYLESLANEKTISFSKDDLERIQEKAKNLHWLSSHEENPDAIRPKHFYIKELPKRQGSSVDISTPQVGTSLHQRQSSVVNLHQYNSLNQGGDSTQNMKKESEKPKNAVKDFLIKVKCIDPEQIKIIKKKVQIRNNESMRQERAEHAVDQHTTIPSLKVGNREGAILNKVRANIDRINMDSNSIISPLNQSILQDTINQTQNILKDAIDQSKQKKEQDLERKNFIMNVIGNNQIYDQKNLDLDKTKSKAKSLQTEMKQIYRGYNKEALTDVSKIKNDMLIQAFKKKIEKDLNSNGDASVKEAIKQRDSTRRISINNSFSQKGQVPNSTTSMNTNGLQLRDAFMFEDTPSHINLAQRSKQRQQIVDQSSDLVQKQSLLNVPVKRQIYLLNDESQVDSQLEQVGQFKKLSDQYLKNPQKNQSFLQRQIDSAQNFNSSDYTLSVDIPPNSQQSFAQQSHQIALAANKNLILSRQPKTQAQKIQEFLTETQNKIQKLQKENFEMQLMSSAQHHGEDYYQKQFHNQNSQIFQFVKNNEAQDLHRFLKTNGSEYANVVDKLGETPLHWAVKRGFSECVEVLLNFGADPSIEDSFQRSSYMLTEKNKILEIEKMLRLHSEGNYEINHEKFEARELILKDPSPSKKKQKITILKE